MNFSPRKDLIYVTHNVTIEIRECLIMIQKEKAPQIARPLNLDGMTPTCDLFLWLFTAQVRC